MSPFVGNATILAVFLELGFVTLWMAAGSAQQRRSHFWGRILLASLVVPALMAVLAGIDGLNMLSDEGAKAVLSLFVLLGVIGLILVPGVLYDRVSSPPGPSESDGGGGSGPEPPLPSPDAPRGGIPLPDAEQARARRRDHTGGQARTAPRRRRDRRRGGRRLDPASREGRPASREG